MFLGAVPLKHKIRALQIGLPICVPSNVLQHSQG